MFLKLGIAIEDTWAFFHDIYTELTNHHEITVFKQRNNSFPIFNNRINEYLFRHDLQSFMAKNDVVFFEWASGLLAAASHLPKTCGIVTRLHRFELYEWADKINWDHVDRIILVSNAKQGEFARRFPNHAHKVVVIPEAISLDRFHVIQRKFQGDIGILCHLTPRKRVYELILAFYELLQRRNNFHLHIGGGTRPRFMDYYEALHHLVGQLGIQDNVTFYGNVSNPEIWYHNIDIFISNSYSEGLQVSPIEAIASGCHCICHGWAGADELLPEENIYFTNAQLVQRILDYSDASEKDQILAKEGVRCYVYNHFDLDLVKVQIRQVIEHVASIPAH